MYVYMYVYVNIHIYVYIFTSSCKAYQHSSGAVLNLDVDALEGPGTPPDQEREFFIDNLLV